MSCLIGWTHVHKMIPATGNMIYEFLDGMILSSRILMLKAYET